MERWEFLRQRGKTSQEEPVPNFFNSAENQFQRWSNDNVEAIGSGTFHDLLELSYLMEEAPILIGTWDMHDSEDDEADDQESTRPPHIAMMEEPHVVSSDSNYMIWENNHDAIIPILEEQNLARERLPPDKENQMMVSLIAEYTPLTSETWDQRENLTNDKVDGTHLI